MPHLRTVLCLLTVGVATLAGQVAHTDWPRWRGGRSDGTTVTSSGTFDGSFELKVGWRRSLGAGYSGIAVAGGRAVTMFSDGTRDHLVALATVDGAELWRQPLGATFPGRDGSTGGPVSTPAIHREVVFALGPRGNLIAARLSDGTPLWTRDLVKDFGATEPHWGFTTSPLPVNDLVVISAGGTSGQAVVALDAKTGTLAWKAGEDTVSYQSPMLTSLDGRELVIAAGDRYLYGVDPRNGAELWRHEHGGTGFYGRIINPVRIGNRALLLTYKPDASILIEPGGAAPREVWTTRELKLNYATPVVRNDVVFGYSGAFLSAIDAANGDLKWRSRAPGDGFPILVDDHLVVLTKQGQLVVAPATDRGFEPTASLQVLSHLAWTPPSFADGRIFVRDSYEGIAAVEILRSKSSTTSPSTSGHRDPTRPGTLPDTRFGRWVAETETAADVAARVDAFLSRQTGSPIIEGDRVAHILFRGDGADLVFRSDVIGTGVDWPLNRVGTSDLYYVSLDLEPDARVSYQFVRALGDTLADPRNPAKGSSQNFAGDVSLLLMPKAERLIDPLDAPLRGSLREIPFNAGTASAAHLRWNGSRPVHIYLPPSYEADPARRFPVAYVLYGEEMLRQGKLAALLESEMGRGLAEMIITFVPSTNPYEYARSFREPHMKMMAEEIVPWIDGQFRTQTAAAGRILLGADEAGFAAIEIGLRHPALFGRIAAQSLFPLSSGDRELLALIDRAPKGSQQFYVDWGRYDPRRRTDRLDVRGFSSQVHAHLRERGFPVSGREWNDGSTVQFWAHRAVLALQALSSPSSR